MKHSAEVRRCLVELDVDTMRRLASEVFIGMPVAKDDREVLTTMHVARTSMASLPFKLRAYSHAWLKERNLPSQLHPTLWPKAERMFPQVVEGVGIAVQAFSSIGRAIAPIIEGAMSDAVMDIYADNLHPNAKKVKKRIIEVREKTVVQMIGRKSR